MTTFANELDLLGFIKYNPCFTGDCAIAYPEGGECRVVCKYINGKQHGIQSFFSRNGVKIGEMIFKNGNLTKERWFDEENELIYPLRYGFYFGCYKHFMGGSIYRVVHFIWSSEIIERTFNADGKQIRCKLLNTTWYLEVEETL